MLQMPPPILVPRLRLRLTALIYLILVALAMGQSLPLPGNQQPVCGQVGEGPGDTAVTGQLSLVPWRIEFHLSNEEFAALEPPASPGFPGPLGNSGAGNTGTEGTGVGEERPAVAGDRESVINQFGTRFPWVSAQAHLRVPDSTQAPQAGDSRAIQAPCRLRYDGDFTYLFSAASPKRPLYFELLGDPGDGEQDPLGENSSTESPAFANHPTSAVVAVRGRGWRLQTMQFDPTLLRQRAAVHVATALRVPTPRITHAQVYLRVGEAAPRFIGLYTLLEAVDQPLLSHYKIPAESLRIQQTGLNGWADLGDQWPAYAALFRLHRPATVAEQQRIIALAKLIGTATDQEFRERIGDFVDLDGFLRYLAAQAITSNVTGFSTLGVNDLACLDIASGRFTFVANEWETALGGAVLSGTPEQLADLSVLRPFAGPCLLVERLLGDPQVKQQYWDVLRSSLQSEFSESQVTAMANLLLEATGAARAAEAKAAPERMRIIAAAGGVAFGGPPPGGPQPLGVAQFLNLRRTSVERQLAGGEAYVPSPPNMGGFGRREGAAEAISNREFRESVQVPPGFQATLFARSPEVNYPVAIAAEPTGAIYVGIDEQGSLGTSPGGGRVVRCVDSDGDGVMEQLTVFCRVDHVRGVAYRDGQVWVSHPPFLSVFRDRDGDGIADEQQQLVSGLTTEMVNTRGGDHTTNGVRWGIDGWLYIGAGDYGVPGAVGVDGSQVILRGGGILRVRPDGTELELVASGLRNPFDIAIDPYLNLFTRDNTNDGGGWDTRISQLHATAEYGYPRLFANFSDEIMLPLGTFGGGGGTGGLYVEDPGWPASLNRSLLTSDWGRSAVFHHQLRADGPTFRIDQTELVSIPRATGMDLDAAGNLYVASWWSGEASVYVGPHVGFVTRVGPAAVSDRVFPQLADCSLADLIDLLRAPQAVVRFHIQAELLRRGDSVDCQPILEQTISDADFPLTGRIAALFALKQICGADAHVFLLEQLPDPSIREFAIRALADRRTQLTNLSCEPFLPYLHDPNPRVVVQAVIALGRLGDPRAADWLLPLAEVGNLAGPDPAQPNRDRVIPHLAVQSIVKLEASQRCLAALDGEYWRPALRALRQMHDSQVVQGLIGRLAIERDLDRRTEILATLIRLYQQETPYDGSWWGIRPDTTGPFYDPMTWSASEQIEQVVRVSLETTDPETRQRLLAELKRHQIEWEGLTDMATPESPPESAPIEIVAVDPLNPRQIGNLDYAEALRLTLSEVPSGDPHIGARLFQTRSCGACHTSLAGQQPVGPHLADIGRRYKPDELIESILKPSEKIAQGYETQMVLLTSGEVISGFVISETGRQIWLRDSQGGTHKIARSEIEERRRQSLSAMPEGLVSSLEPAELAALIAYLQSL